MFFSYLHKHQWSDWQTYKGHYWDHANFNVRYCGTCHAKEYSLIYLHCPKKKIKGEYCHWCIDWGREWDNRIVLIDKTCYDIAMENTEKPRMGRPIDMESLKKALEYRSKGLGVLEVARVMQKDPTQIVRWYAYVDKNKVKV